MKFNSPAEEKVYSALKHSLSSSHEILPSTTYLSNDDKRFIREGEIDILLFNHEVGILVLEVKGGGIAYHGERKQWFSIDRNKEYHEIKDPFEQAKAGARWIANRIEKDIHFDGGKVPIPVAFAVFFPDINWENNQDLPANAEKDLIFDASDLKDPIRKIDSIFKNLFQKKYYRALTKSERGQIRSKILYPMCHVLPSMKSQIEQEEVELHRLTEEQFYILDGLAQCNRIAIKGYAGTGKTLLAVEKARRLHNEGKKVALLCFNKALATSLQEHIGNTDDNFIVRHFHGLCRDYCEAAGIPFNITEDSSNFWDDIAPLKMIEALEISNKRFDAIIVDEGQDFKTDWWDVIDELLVSKDKSCLYIFFDPQQKIYRDELKFPVEISPFILTRNCRNTRRIGELVGSLGKVEMSWATKSIEGKNPKLISFKNPEEQVSEIQNMIKELVKKDKVGIDDIVILSPHKLEKSCLRDIHEIAGFQITDDLFNHSGKIRFTTLHSFKGLEANVVILCDVESDKKNCTDEHLYVAASRAKHLLFILHDKKWKVPQN